MLSFRIRIGPYLTSYAATGKHVGEIQSNLIKIDTHKIKYVSKLMLFFFKYVVVVTLVISANVSYVLSTRLDNVKPLPILEIYIFHFNS